MKNYNNFRRMLRAAVVAIAAAATMMASCTKVDDTLGSNLVPDNQQMLAGYTTLPLKGELNPRKYVETRLFQTDSIISSNLGSGYFGSKLSDTLGLRSAGFLSQYISYYRVDSGYFGFRPIFDSAQMLLSITSYDGDTTRAQKFAVYEVVSNKYITEKPIRPGKTVRDSVFYLDFKPKAPAPGSEPVLGDKLFTFTLGGDKIGPATKAVTMTPTDAGKEYISRLMLQSGDYKGRYGIYSADSLWKWVEAFKGLYVEPENTENEYGKGTIYTTSLDATGLSVYGRNRVESDPTLIKDTIGMVFYFYNSGATAGNVSINSVERDYSLARTDAKIVLENAVESNPDRPENSRAYVDGMGGVVTELTISEAFFTALQDEIARINGVTGKNFRSLAFSQARMSVYFNDSDYDWTLSPANPVRWIEQMGAAPSRLGLYTDYKKLSPITDYAYAYEQTYGTELAYGGKVNRSRGCYVMDVTGYIQTLWNSFIKEAEAAQDAGREIVWDNVEKRRIYLAPEAYGLFTSKSGVLQGQSTENGSPVANNAPIRFELAYNMIK